MSGNNSFGGSASALTINGGTIQSSGTRAYANNITVGGNFTNTGTGNATFNGTVGLGAATRTITNSTASGSRIYSGVISGTLGSGLTFDGTGAGQTYVGGTNTFTGTISVNGSEVGFASNAAFGNAANTIVIDGGRLSAASTSGGSVTYTLASTHGIQVGDGVGTGISAVSGGVLTYDGVIADKTAETGSWAKQGSGSLLLGGVSTYTGTTAINNGIVQLTTGNNRLPTGTTVSLGQAASANLGTLNLNGFSQQIAGLNSTSGTNASASDNTVTSAGAATLTIGGAGNYVFGDGTAANSGVIAGAISLVKNGAGIQTLGDINTYTGATNVTNGTLVVAATGSTAAGSAVSVGSSGALVVNGSVLGSTTVASGGTLSGTGSLGGLTTINGTHNPGTSPGLQNFAALTYNTSSIFNWELNSNTESGRGTSFDAVNASGALTFSGTPTSNLLFSGTVDFTDTLYWGINREWLVFDAGSVTGIPFTIGTITGGSYSLAVGTFAYNAVGNDVYLNFTAASAVPEPMSFVYGSLIAGIVGVGAWKRRRKSSNAAANASLKV